MIQTVPIIKPPRLNIQDRIGLISPAGTVRKSELEAGIRTLVSAGFRPRLAPHAYDCHHYMAGTDIDRLKDLTAMLADSSIQAVLCTRGGYGSLRLLEHLDFELFRANPKIFIGFSDITALLLAVHQRTGLITFHGPMLRDLASGHPDNQRDMLDLLTGGKAKWDLRECSVLKPGEAHGPLMGGNLSLICHLLGTPFMPRLDGCIFFLEDRGEALYRIDRMLTHLWLSGRIKNISGIIAGRFENCGEQASLERLFSEIADRLGVPLVSRFAVGHGHRNRILPLGAPVHLSTKTLTLSLTETCVL